MTLLNADHFTVEAYLPYPSVVRDKLNEYDEFIRPSGDRHVKLFFEQICEKVKNIYCRDYFDNKIAFRVRHNETGTILYVGYKDNTWSIGLTAVNMDDENRVIEFEKLKKFDSPGHIVNNIKYDEI